MSCSPQYRFFIAFGLAALCVGCGRLGYDAAAMPDATGPDATVPLGPFGSPTLLAELSEGTSRDDDPTLTRDRLELYLNSNRAGGPGNGDIWVSTRASTDDPWSPPTLVAELSSPDAETGPEVSPDGLTIFFASDRAGGAGSTDVWTSTRSSRVMPWAAPTVVSELNTASEETAPTPGWSPLILTLESTRPGGAGSADLYLTTRPTAASAWSPPTPIPGVNTVEHEGSPHLGPRSLTLVCNGTRAGNTDIHIATRPSVDDPFGPLVPLPELNSPDNEQDPWISEDLRHIVFVSARSGSLRIYEAFR